MRFILSDFSGAPGVVFGRALKGRGHEIAYWVRKQKSRAVPIDGQFLGAVFHDTEEAICGIPAPGIAVDTLPMPGADVYRHIAPHEGQILQMMSKRVYKTFLFQEMRHLYNWHIRYWYGVLAHVSPDGVFFADVPHTGHNAVLYHVARYLGIPTIMMKAAKGVPGYSLVFDDYEAYTQLRSTYRDALNSPLEQRALSAELRSFYTKVQNRDSSAQQTAKRETVYIAGIKNSNRIIPRLGAVLKNIQSRSLITTFFSYCKMLARSRPLGLIDRQEMPGLRWKLHVKKLLAETKRFQKRYATYAQRPDFKSPYVYVPLHYQPECATNPLGGVFDDQILMLETLSRALPDHWRLYVKEHPAQWSRHRSAIGRFEKFYEAISQLPHVVMVAPEISTFDLIEHAKAIATITGTAGWEAVMRSKPVLLFGLVWYMDCEGIFQVESAEMCAEAMQRIESGYCIDQKKVIAFLAALEQVGFKGYFHTSDAAGVAIAWEDNFTDLAHAYEQAFIEASVREDTKPHH